ncbi:lipase family protein [Candidatus Protochlamydia phocaeensis]|uniref:lipase family protein n=1 Tax=Candidatus Protochlamydia phocaeensis TaxID=1414722 RepID=UPI000837C3F9|nr:DUF2974 domain-containing protein [Candidatus Protochlamydia phocaeensis]
MSVVNHNHNFQLLHRVISESSQLERANAHYTPIQELVALAAARVLKNMDAFITGSQRLTHAHYKKIKREVISLQESINETIYERNNYFAFTGHCLLAMLSRLRDNMRLEKAQKFEDYYQIMGCVTSYGKWQPGDTIIGPDAALSDYVVHKVITNAKGLQLVVLVPSQKEIKQDRMAAPILCCRGTTSDLHNLVDDVKTSIGKYGLKESKEDILSVLQEVSQIHGPVVVTGHSLGGAIAQRIGVEFCDVLTNDGQSIIQSIYHYNAPGIGRKAVRQFEAKKQSLPPSSAAPRVYGYEHEEDFVVAAGGAHLKAHSKIILHDNSPIGYFHFFYRILTGPFTTLGNAHFSPKLVSEFNKTDITIKSRPLWQIACRKMIELTRQFLGRTAKRLLIFQIEKEKELERKTEVIKQFINGQLRLNFHQA